MTSLLKDPYPVVELAPPPRAQPIVEPRLISPTPMTAEEEEEEELRIQPIPSYLPNPGQRSLQRAPSNVDRAKRESFNLSGSTYLITDTGKTLKLPIPSDSAADPLNWSQWKTAGAMFSIALYSVVCLTAAQAASVILEGIQNDTQVYNVCYSPLMMLKGTKDRRTHLTGSSKRWLLAQASLWVLDVFSGYHFPLDSAVDRQFLLPPSLCS